jgi:acyl-CoA thioesterase FadM
MAAYWRALAHALPRRPCTRLQGDLYVRKATLEYLGSARYDEQLEVGMRCARIGNSSTRVRGGGLSAARRCLVHGELVYVFADPATQTQPARCLPAAARACFLGYRGRARPWSTCADGATGPRWAPRHVAIRQAVFVDEQQHPG